MDIQLDPLKSETIAIQSKRIRVFLDSVMWFARPRNTDWRYVRYTLPLLSQFEPVLDLYLQRSLQVARAQNIDWVKHALSAKLGRPSAGNYRVYLDSIELLSSRSDVVFSHRGFPDNADPTPVVWQNSILDPEMTSFYHGPRGIQREIDLKGPLFFRSAVVHVSTEAEVRRLRGAFPESADKFFATPFFVPGASAESPTILSKHLDKKPIEILFVGDQAKRKGLDVLIAAFRQLSHSIRQGAKLTIVSRLSDGEVLIPEDPQIEVHRGLPHPVVIQKMKSAHILAVPSRFESYGLAFLEAMSKGVVPIAPNWEVQRELLENGRAGVLVNPGSSESLRVALECLIEDQNHRLEIADNALKRFSANYAPERVAKRFVEMFQLARSRG
jgi:glycosyltransferase involved in cell wall biosynthesis